MEEGKKSYWAMCVGGIKVRELLQGQKDNSMWGMKGLQGLAV